MGMKCSFHTTYIYFQPSHAEKGGEERKLVRKIAARLQLNPNQYVKKRRKKKRRKLVKLFEM